MDTSEDKKQALTKGDGGNRVTMTNALTRAAHNLSLSEKRIVMMGVSKIDSKKVYQPHEVPKTRIYALDYAETFGVDPDTAYRELKTASKRLFKRYITFYEAAEKRNGKPLPPTIVNMAWIGEAHYQKGEGWVELHWWPKLFLTHLSAIKKHFTSYQLEQASALRSKHSWKLLELLSRFSNKGEAYYELDDFKTAVEASKPQSANFGKLRTQIIEPAVEELVKKDGWLIDWTPHKKGRKVIGLHFRFARNPQGSLDL